MESSRSLKRGSISHRRQRGEGSGRTASPFRDRWYQVHHGCEHTGRYFRSSKRKITWVVGSHGDSKGRERSDAHKVELIWSVKSRKAKVLVDECELSRRRLHEQVVRSDAVNVAWETDSGEVMKILAHADEPLSKPQYDLWVDGKSFFNFPTLSQVSLGSASVPPTPPIVQEPMRKETVGEERRDIIEIAETLSDLGSGDYCFTPTADVDFRLSMAGLNNLETVEVVDELHSELYSPMLKSLRSQVTAYLPQLEDTISRAIIKAFFVDTDSQHSADCSSSVTTDNEKLDPYQIEAEALCEAYEWVGDNFFGDSIQEEELRLAFVQEKIDSIFMRVRNDELSPEQASRILLSICCLLGLKFATDIPKDTVIFSGLGTSTTDNDLYRTLIVFGSVSATAVATTVGGFGFCRFEDPYSVKLLEMAVYRNEFVVAGVSPTCTVLSESLHGDLAEIESLDLDEKKIEERCDSPSVYDPSGPRTSIPHLMAPLGGSDFATTYPFFSMSETSLCTPVTKVRPVSEHTSSCSSGADSDALTDPGTVSGSSPSSHGTSLTSGSRSFTFS